MVDMSAVLTTLFACSGSVAIGTYATRSGVLDSSARKGIAALYSKIVFPTVVFLGVAAIDMATIDRTTLLVMLASKATLAAIIVSYGYCLLRSTHAGSALAHAGMWAMAASHSFDVTLGVPLARTLFPESVAYAYLNQSVQLVLVNPILIVLIESGGASGGSKGGGGRLLKALRDVASNPLVAMTVLGLIAGQAFPASLPVPVEALAKQISGAGAFLGFLALGFAMGTLGGTSTAELSISSVLCAAKLVLMPVLYVMYGTLLHCDAPVPLLVFLGTLPASASVYSLSLTKQLSPSILGPLVPASVMLCVALSFLPLWPLAAAYRATDVLRLCVCLGGASGLFAAAAGLPSPAKSKAS